MSVIPADKYYPVSRYRPKIFCLAGRTHRVGGADYTGLTPKLEQIIRAFEFTQIALAVSRDRGYCEHQLAARQKLARQLRLFVQMGKVFIEFGLHALAHATEHQRHQSWQGQLALASEGTGVIGTGCVQEKFSRTQACGKIAKKRVEGHVGQ